MLGIVCAMPITDITKNVEEQVLGVLAIAQETVVDSVQKFAEAVDPIIPDVPRPFAAEATDLLDGAFTFAEKLLQNSHEFVGKLIEAADTSSKSSTNGKPAPATKASAK